MKTRSSSVKSPAAAAAVRCASGVVTCVLMVAAAAALLAVALTAVDIPRTAYDPLMTFTSSLAVAVSAMLSSKKHKERGLMFGFAIAVGFFIVLLTAGLAMGDVGFSENAVYKLMALLSSGGIGGYLGLPGRASSKKKSLA